MRKKHKSNANGFRKYLDELEKHYIFLYSSLEKDIKNWIKRIWNQRCSCKTFNDNLHASSILATAIGINNYLKRRTNNYKVYVEYRVKNANLVPDVYATYKMNGKILTLIIEVESNPPSWIPIYELRSHVLGRLSKKTLRYSPSSGLFYVCYPKNSHPSEELLIEFFKLFNSKNRPEEEIKELINAYQALNGGSNGDYLLSNLSDAHVEGILFVDENGVLFTLPNLIRRLP